MTLLDKATLVVTPNGFKASKLYSVIPINGTEDLTAERSTTANRINESNVLQLMGLNVSRVDYESGKGVILAEPQATNYLRSSNVFTQPPYGLSPTASINGTAFLSPDGSNNASLLQVLFSAGFIRRQPNVNLGHYSWSCYVKNPTTGTVTMRIYTNNTNIIAKIVLSTGQITLSGNTVNYVSSRVKLVKNGWYRIGVTFASTESYINLALYPTSYPASDNSSCQIYGWQLEKRGETSYIPTTSQIFTRISDRFLRQNMFNNGVITSNGGTYFLDLKNNIPRLPPLTNNGCYIGDSLVFGGNLLSIRAENLIYERLTIAKSTGSNNITTLYTTLTDNVKIAITWNGSSADVWVNGVKVVSATPFTATNMNIFSLDGSDGTKNINSSIVFPAPLSEPELIYLTTI